MDTWHFGTDLRIRTTDLRIRILLFSSVADKIPTRNTVSFVFSKFRIPNTVSRYCVNPNVPVYKFESVKHFIKLIFEGNSILLAQRYTKLNFSIYNMYGSFLLIENIGTYRCSNSEPHISLSFCRQHLGARYGYDAARDFPVPEREVSVSEEQLLGVVAPWGRESVGTRCVKKISYSFLFLKRSLVRDIGTGCLALFYRFSLIGVELREGAWMSTIQLEDTVPCFSRQPLRYRTGTPHHTTVLRRTKCILFLYSLAYQMYAKKKSPPKIFRKKCTVCLALSCENILIGNPDAEGNISLVFQTLPRLVTYCIFRHFLSDIKKLNS